MFVFNQILQVFDLLPDFPTNKGCPIYPTAAQILTVIHYRHRPNTFFKFIYLILPQNNILVIFADNRRQQVYRRTSPYDLCKGTYNQMSC